MTPRPSLLELVERERAVLARIAAGDALGDVLADLLRAVESRSGAGDDDRMLTSVLLLSDDGLRLDHGAAPSLPAAYNEAIDGIAIGEGVGSCGTVVAREAPVYANDIASDPLWVDFRDLALAHGLRACWSTPIAAVDGRLLGTFAVYYTEVRSPTPEDLESIAFVTQTAGLAIERYRSDRVLRLSLADQQAAIDALAASEAAAREDAERVQLALEAGAILGTWAWDVPADSYVIDRGFARGIGLDPALGREGLTSAQIVASIHPDDRDAHAAAVRAALASGGAFAHQYRVERADGRYYWVEASGRVELDSAGRPLRFPGILTDVEERRAVEAERDRAAAALRALNETLEQRVAERTAELLQAEERLRQSQKMEAVGQLTGGLAHDFNNLLAGISGSLELMSMRIAQGRAADVEKYLAAAQGAAKRAASLTHRLLAFSRRQTLAPKPTDVNRLVGGMLDLVQRTVGPEIAVEVVGADELWPALVDQSQLENALLNLCINARDAMPDGGRIVVEMSNRRINPHAAHRRDMPEGHFLALSVTDTGTGMPPHVVEKAFDPFFTTKPIGEGTGLGLSMIYGFAKQSGGQVRIHSEVDRGTTVSIFLPRHRGDGPAEEEGGAASPARLAEAGETVLVVDDEPTLRMLVTDVLSDLGYTAIEANDGAAGLRILQSDARVDLLITDVGLPGGMNGRQLADAGTALRPTLKVLFITGYAETALVRSGQLDARMSVLPKPFAVEALGGRVRELIGG